MLDSDLAALIIRLRATMPIRLSQHMGRAIHALFFRLIGEPLASAIHPQLEEGTHREMPFTVSGLLRTGSSDPLFGNIQPGDTAWIRITGLTSEVVAALIGYRTRVREQLARGEIVYEDIDYMPWQVTDVDWDSHTLPGLFSYGQLIDMHKHGRPAQQITLHFASTTTFRSQSVNLPLPLPHLVFGSLVTRWQAFTNCRLRELSDDQVDAFVRHHILLSRHDIESTLYRFKQGGKEVGFTGSAAFEFIIRSEHLQKQDPSLERLLQREYIWFARTMMLLTDFAYYSGIGRKTTSGMGLIRN